MSDFIVFVPYREFEKHLGVKASAYREHDIEGSSPSAKKPEPVYGVLERMDTNYVLRRKKDFVKLEDGEGVYVL